MKHDQVMWIVDYKRCEPGLNATGQIVINQCRGDIYCTRLLFFLQIPKHFILIEKKTRYVTEENIIHIFVLLI